MYGADGRTVFCRNEYMPVFRRNAAVVFRRRNTAAHSPPSHYNRYPVLPRRYRNAVRARLPVNGQPRAVPSPLRRIMISYLIACLSYLNMQPCALHT